MDGLKNRPTEDWHMPATVRLIAPGPQGSDDLAAAIRTAGAVLGGVDETDQTVVFDLRDVVFGDDADALLPTAVMQPSIFAIGYRRAERGRVLQINPRPGGRSTHFTSCPLGAGRRGARLGIHPDPGTEARVGRLVACPGCPLREGSGRPGHSHSCSLQGAHRTM